METAFALTVSQLNRYLKELLSLDDVLAGVWLRGEASNVTRHASGHLYFTLKDADAQMSCAMWKPDAARLRFPVESGAAYLARGRVTIWEKRGSLQFSVEHLEPDGRGALHVAYERLKKRLESEGLFDDSRKRPLPGIPRRVGIVTSLTGAAVHDMIRILRERHPRIDLVLIPAVVQGDGAPESLAAAITAAARIPDLDVIIVGRGGGSIEDLWAFNDERVVRAVSESTVAVVSAVGHETDFTLVDFAADVRAATPTAAAQVVAPAILELHEGVDALLDAVFSATARRLREERSRVETCLDRAVFHHPLEMTRRRRAQVELLRSRLPRAVEAMARFQREHAMGLAGRLDALSPLGVLARGYAIARGPGGVIRSVVELSPGDRIGVQVSDGKLDCSVQRIKLLSGDGNASATENRGGARP